MSLLTYSRDQTSVHSTNWFKYFAFLCTICVIPPKLENRVLGLLLSNVMFTQNSIFYLFKHKVLICLPSRTQLLTYLPDRNSLLSPPLAPAPPPPPPLSPPPTPLPPLPSLPAPTPLLSLCSPQGQKLKWEECLIGV